MIKEIAIISCLAAVALAMPAAEYIPAALDSYQQDNPAILVIQQESDDLEGAETAHHGSRGGYGGGYGGYGGGYGGYGGGGFGYGGGYGGYGGGYGGGFGGGYGGRGGHGHGGHHHG